MKNIHLLSIISIFAILVAQNEFSQGPYGTGYFDTAAPFSLVDLSTQPQGDINNDEVTNIQDIILTIGQIMGTINLTPEQVTIADINSDGTVDILDIVQLVNLILNPQSPTWDFEPMWTGGDIYIFIHYDPNVGGSTGLWNSNTKETFLNNSPDNVHYFFLSGRTYASSDVSNMRDDFNEVLTDFSLAEQAHWNAHLHFVPIRTYDFDNWISETVNGKYAFAIDGFQQIREIGYLGNPATFSGTYLSYIAHEAVYLNYELETFLNTDEVYDEIVIFDEEIYTGGWASTTTKIVDLPDDLSIQEYNKLEVDLLRGCPDGAGGYSDAGCDDYDRIAHLYMCHGQCFETQYFWDADETTCLENGSSWDSEEEVCFTINYIEGESLESCGEENWNYNRQCQEITRWITPFDRQPRHLTDISSFISFLRPGGSKMFKYQESGWPNSLLTMKLRLSNDSEITESPKEHKPMWAGTVQFNPSYGDNRPPQVFSVPSEATKVEFVAYITGHGWGSAGCYNCSEFCNSKHIFSLNGGVYEFNTSYPNASDNDYCMQIETIAEGVIPNQYGTWGYGRAGWCPGQDVKPYTVDITQHVQIGEENILDYDACRVVGNSCLTPPTCQGDGYCPEIAFSSYIIYYY